MVEVVTEGCSVLKAAWPAGKVGRSLSPPAQLSRQVPACSYFAQAPPLALLSASI